MYTKGEPHVLDLSKGDTVYICQCGKTSSPPYCDGSHQGPNISIVILHRCLGACKYQAEMSTDKVNFVPFIHFSV